MLRPRAQCLSKNRFGKGHKVMRVCEKIVQRCLAMEMPKHSFSVVRMCMSGIQTGLLPHGRMALASDALHQHLWTILVRHFAHPKLRSERLRWTLQWDDSTLGKHV